ncbi:hypothetical protein BMS3Abin02_01542 [bacterium BMS3Abin02]|nr:hypothetical protein BMS3Abin02_01542 [bacterium BMS3Abin02]GBE21701.1 hypothetical protein BMS3Bbin01_01050 [bacterium BMS3Bbin01]HDK45792.1 hypothetical protein [Actinomycetota bacterium]HDL48824.1 hypothetical protein [Actinomycetota bacterium]
MQGSNQLYAAASYHDKKLYERDRQTRTTKVCIPEDKAQQVLETVLGFLKDKLPGSIAEQPEGALEEGAGSVADAFGGLTNRPRDILCR